MTAPTRVDDDDQAAPPAATVKGVGLLARLAESEPVRLYLYAVAAAVLAALVCYGVLTTSQAAIWGGVAAAVLSIPVTEGVRSQVVSPRTAAALAAGK
jgi:anti-sigma factor RsiW